MTTSTIAARLRGPDGWLLMVSVLLFLAAMPLESFCTPDSCSEWPSYSLLFLGWLELYIFPRAGYVWLANPALLMAWWYLFKGRKIAAVALSLTALVLAASFLAVAKVMVAELEPPAPLRGYALGYWLWLASAGAVFLGALLTRVGGAAKTSAS